MGKIIRGSHNFGGNFDNKLELESEHVKKVLFRIFIPSFAFKFIIKTLAFPQKLIS